MDTTYGYLRVRTQLRRWGVECGDEFVRADLYTACGCEPSRSSVKRSGNLAAASPQGGAQAQGIGFAIPSNLARDIAWQLIDSGHVTNSHRAALGAEVATVTGPDGAPGGAGVVTVTSGSPADRAGLRAGAGRNG